MSDSIGKISLDLEIKADISKQIQETAGNIGEQLKQTVNSVSKGAFSEMNKEAKKSMSEVSKTIQTSTKSVSEQMKKNMKTSISSGIKEAASESESSMKQMAGNTAALMRQTFGGVFAGLRGGMRGFVGKMRISDAGTVQEDTSAPVPDTTTSAPDATRGSPGASARVIDLKNKIRETQNAIEALNQEMAQLGEKKVPTAKVIDLQNKIKETKDAVKTLNAEMEELGNKKVPTADFADLRKEIIDTSVKLDTLLDKENKLSELGTKKNSKTWKGLQYDIEATKNALQSLHQAEAEMKSAGAAYSAGTETAEYAQKGEQLSSLTSKLNSYISKLDEVNAKEAAAATAAFDQKRAKVEQLTGKLNTYTAKLDEVNAKEAAAAGVMSKFNATVTVLNKGFTVAGSGLKKLGGFFSSLIAKMKQAITHSTKTGRSFRGLGNDSNNLGKSVLRLGNMLKMMVIRKALQAIISGTKEGFQNLAQYSNEVNTSISSMMNALTKLKNTFAAAFAPILNVVAPILTTFINILIKGINYIGMFFAALTGASSYNVAKDVNDDYAASLGDAASNADDANDATKEYQKTLAGFDEINKSDSQSDSSSSNSGTSGGTSGGTSASDMFETVPINGWAKDLASMIKEAWEKADFSEIGKIVARKLNSVLENLDWEKIKTTLNKIASSVATFLNGFIEETKWDVVGDTLAQGINAVFGAANTFAEEFKWDELGKAVGTGINSALGGLDWTLIKTTIENIVGGITDTLNNLLNTTDWELVGETFAEVINTIITAGYTFVTTFEWLTFGLAIASAINGALRTMDLGLAAKTLSDGIKGFLATITTAINEIDWALVGQQVGDMLKNIDWLGIASGLFDAGLALIGGLLEAFGNLPIPVQVAAAAIAALWVVAKGYTIISGIVTAISAAGGLIPAITSLIGVLGNPIVLAIAAVIAACVLLIANWDTVKQAATDLWTGVRSAFEGFKTWLSNIFSTDWSAKFGGMGDILNSFLVNVENIWNSVKSILNGIVTFISGVFTGDWSKAWDGLKTIVSGVFDGLVSIVKTPINAIIGVLNGLISGVASAVNSVSKMLNSISITIPDWVPGIGGGTWSPNLPTWTPGKIPYMETGGIVDAPTLAMVGENGQEAVMPLERNTGWIRNLAGQLEGYMNSNGGGSGITKEEMESLINNGVMRIVAALADMAFNLDGEQMGKAQIRKQSSIDRRWNTAKVT